MEFAQHKPASLSTSALSTSASSTSALPTSAASAWRFAKLATPVAAVSLILMGCLATTPQSNGQSATVGTGSAGGATATGANSKLESCPATLGTIRLDEQTGAGWYATYISRYGTGSTLPVLRLLIQQSNCFIIVDRGRGLAAGNAERDLMRGAEGRAGSNVGTGQIAAADFTLIPEVIVSDRGGTKGGLGGLGGLLGGKAALLGAVAGGFSTNEAGTVLTLIDNRSSVQLAAAEGYATNTDFGGMGALFGAGGGAGASAFTSTPQGKVLMASFADAYNKMVQSVRAYKAQTVKGGLGTGGTLGVQGGSTAASKEVDQAAKPAPASKPSPTAPAAPAKKKPAGT